jgi:hypothetical protein
MAQPQISVRALDSNHDPIYGNGQNNFLNDIQAVAQIVQTSLLLFQGEWWEDLNEGLPLFQQILGTNNGKKTDAISLLIQNVILTCCPPFITGVKDIVTVYRTNRNFTFACVVETVFGLVTVNFTPGAAAVLPT